MAEWKKRMKARRYKKSQFNYVQENQECVLIYNTLYNALVRLNWKEYDMYLGKTVIDDELLQEFIDNGLWIEEEVDEYSAYIACSRAYTLFSQKPLSITITTTLKCNAKCIYCYEKGVKQVDIFEGAEEKIVQFIKAHMIQNAVHLTWFGGEPLINSRFMDSLSQRLKNEGIDYTSYIITNGSLITDALANEKFKLWNVKEIQITLDGTCEEYRKRKRYVNPDEGDFYRILNNIRIIAKSEVFVNIRLNIDRNNKDDILYLLKELDPVFTGYENVVFYPAFITGMGKAMNEEEKVQCIKELLLALKNIRKLSAGTKMYSLPRMHVCMNDDPGSFAIDVYGNICTCDHYVGTGKYIIGNLAQDEFQQDDRGKYVCFREECQTCVFLPKCYGGCKANYVEGDDPCMIEKYLIKAYLEIL